MGHDLPDVRHVVGVCIACATGGDERRSADAEQPAGALRGLARVAAIAERTCDDRGAADRHGEDRDDERAAEDGRDAAAFRRSSNPRARSRPTTTIAGLADVLLRDHDIMWLARYLILFLLPSALSTEPQRPSPSRPDLAAPLVEGDADDALVVAARRALLDGSVDGALPWVAPPDAALVREAFARARSVRRLGRDARAVADEYFVLTVRRLHQISGGGQRYEGDERIDAAIAAAVESGRATAVTRLIVDAVEKGAGARMKLVLSTRKKTGGGTATARLAYVDACLDFARYVERLAIAAADAADPADDAYADGPP